MTMLIGLMTSSIVSSSFAAPIQQTKEDCSQLVVSIPTIVVLYQGYAWSTDEYFGSHPHINIEVRQVLNHPENVWVSIKERNCRGDACNEPYAFALKENPYYNPNDDRKVSEMKYYVTYDGKDYFFDM